VRDSQRSLHPGAACSLALCIESLCDGFWESFPRAEFHIWHALETDTRDFGFLCPLNSDDVANLRALSDLCGGWIHRNDAGEPTWVAMASWQVMFAKEQCE
jgi:hypothetical protein